MSQENLNPDETINPDTSASGPDVGGLAKKGAGAAVNKAKEKGLQGLMNVIRKKFGKEAIKTTAKLSLGAPLAALLLKVFIILVIVILLIGIIMFIVTMPGMVMDKLKNLAEEIGNAWLAWWGQDSSAQVEDEKIYETLDYIEDMGFDLKGYGFLTKYIGTEAEAKAHMSAWDEFLQWINGTEEGLVYDNKVGVVRDAENNVVLAESDFVLAYLTSENYLYTIKNFNLDDINFLEALGNRVWALLADDMNNRTGMLVLKHEGGTEIGQTSENYYDASERGSIKANAKAKTLEIKKGWANGKMIYSLDGWTGRYGMPLDFLVTIHTATFMPDLAYDMAKSFETEVHILLHKSTGSVDGVYKTDSGKYITYEDLNKAMTGMAGRNIVSSFFSWADNLMLNEQEAMVLYNLGIIPDGHNPPDCGCEVAEREVYKDSIYTYYVYTDTSLPEPYASDTSEDDPYTLKYYFNYNQTDYTATKVYLRESEAEKLEKQVSFTNIGSNCKEYWKAVLKYTRKANDYNYETYTPYIEKVTDHWYRDVYFITSGSKDLIDYDYDYEAIMKERWTVYEKYTAKESDKGTYKYNPEKAGQEILLVLDENGKYKKNGDGEEDYVVFDGTIEDARPSTLYVKDGDEYKEYTDGRTTAEKEGIQLYRKNSDGNYVEFTGEVAVSKKAKTINMSEKYKDLNWNKLSNGQYSAYSPIEEKIEDYQKPYTPGQEKYNEGSEIEKSVMNRIYSVVKIGVVNQTGEGQRTETNPDIKKMFLQNNYFRYDGSSETAEIITELRNLVYEKRKESNSKAKKYGALTDDELDYYYPSITIGLEEDTKTIENVYVGDYAGKLEVLTQDALNAFAMLENTHTLDADYIYRDFKELIVELGYFEKEELTDETPRLLQFPVPAIGSAEYPARSIDKRTNEKGTMIHSKYDIETNKEYIKLEIEQSGIGDLGDSEEAAKDVEGNATTGATNNTTLTDEVKTRVNEGRLSLSSNQINITEVGEVAGATKKPSQVSLDEFLKLTREMCEYINDVGYDYCVWRPEGEDAQGKTCTCDSGDCDINHCHHDIHGNPCDLALTFEESKAAKKNNFCCDRLVKWALQNVGLISRTGGAGGAHQLALYIMDTFPHTKIERYEQLQPGDIIYSEGHIEVVGEKKNGALVQYNGGHSVAVGAVEGTPKSSIGLKTSDQSWSWATGGIRLPWGKSEDAMYEGYEGNEAVVSPVTGVLIDYGTYNKADKEERKNIDLKYGPSVTLLLDEEGNVANEPVETPNETEPVENNPEQPIDENTQEGEMDESKYEEVGYAIIRVMTKEDFENFENAITSYWTTKNDGQGLLSSKDGEFYDELETEEELETLLERSDGALAETIYGYKEFAELYSTYGVYINSNPDEESDDSVEEVRKLIAGYTVFIDGFKCELPDEKFVDTNEDGSVADETTKPKGKELTMDSFRISPSKIEENNELIQSQYEMPSEYNLASKSATERLNLEEQIKADAFGALEVEVPVEINGAIKKEKRIYIKEGTVIGRTFTDREVVEDLREDEKIEDYKISMTKTAAELKSDDYVFEDKLIGNYLRVILREDLNGTVVEDVENYMKLDEVTQSGNQEYQFREGDLEILADAIHHEGCGSYCAALLGTSGEEDELYLSKSVGFTIINKLNTDSGFVPDYNDSSKLWDSSRSPLYNLLCRIPSGYDTGGYTTGTSGGWYAIALGLRQRIDANDLEYCDTCFEAAEYIKENDSMNHKNNGKFGADFASGEGMPHTCWQQGAGYNGTSKIWVYIDSNKNGVKDTECVDTGDFYLFDTAN